jgi:hypothetical protein
MISASAILPAVETDALARRNDSLIDPFNRIPTTILDGNIYTYEVTYYAEDLDDLADTLKAVRIALGKEKGEIRWTVADC